MCISKDIRVTQKDVGVRFGGDQHWVGDEEGQIWDVECDTMER